MEETKHISEVCKQLGTTSRTIRYYEQLELIRTVRESRNGPRRLDSENIEQLRKILFLRKIGLSLDEIVDIFRNGQDVHELILTKTTAFKAEISALLSRIQLLQKVTKAAESGESIYDLQLESDIMQENEEHLRIAAKCVKMMLDGQFSEITELFIPMYKQHLKPELISATWNDFIQSCGAFVKTGKQTIEGNFVRNIVHFKKIDAVISVVFKDGGLSGIAFEYWKEKE